MQTEAIQTSETLIHSNLESLKVLIVDDEAPIRDSLSLFLQHLGIRHTRTASDGNEAIEIMGYEMFDYVFVDLMMPEKDGMEVLKVATCGHQPTSVILMTGFPSMEVAIKALNNGASDFLVKPFRLEDIKISLDRIQRMHSLMERNWLLRRELDKKKEVEELNRQLGEKIKLQSILYDIVDSFSKITRSENLYNNVIGKALQSCNARKGCFLIYDHGNAHLLALAQSGFDVIPPGTQTPWFWNAKGEKMLGDDFIEAGFGCGQTEPINLEKTTCHQNILSVPFNIRNEPFGVLIIGEKNDHNSFDEEDAFILKFLAERAAMSVENIALYDNLKQSMMATLMSLVSAIEAKDAYTQQHSTRVTAYALKIASSLGCPYDDLQRLETTAPLHDIGKIGIADRILNKVNPLTEEEYRQIEAHPLIGENIVSPLGLEPDELSIIKHHHERWDGGGYPHGLSQENIPRLARILAVADAFDAMNSDRAYRRARPFDDSMQELKNNRGTQFDPEIVDTALQVLARDENES